METIKSFLHSPVQSYLDLLHPGLNTPSRLYKVATIVGAAAIVTAVATYALFLMGSAYITLSTALLLKKICIIGALVSGFGFLGSFSAEKALEGNRFWKGVYSGAIVAATLVPAILLSIKAVLLLKHASH